MAAATRGKKNQKIDEATKEQVLVKVATMSAEKLNNEFGGMQLNVQKTFAGLQAEVTNKFAMCEELDTAIKLKQSRLKELHDIEATAIQLDDLVAQRELQKHQIDEELDTAQQLRDERQSDWLKENKRKEDEWVYTTDQTHRKVIDAFNQDMMKKQREEALRQEAFNKICKDREDRLGAEEANLESYKKQVEAFPKTLDAEVKKANAILENSIKRDYENRITLMTKDIETNAKLSKEREDSYNNTVKRLEVNIGSLTAQLANAEQRAADIAKTAFESVSGRDALAAVQRHGEQTMPGANTGKSPR